MTIRNEPCKRFITHDGQTFMDSACPDCGHTVMVHPGEHNYTTEICLSCQVEYLWWVVQNLSDALIRVGKSTGQKPKPTIH